MYLFPNFINTDFMRQLDKKCHLGRNISGNFKF